MNDIEQRIYYTKMRDRGGGSGDGSGGYHFNLSL